MSGISRRRLLAVSGVGLVGVAAGCTSSSDASDENGDEDDQTEDDAHTVSGGIIVDNLDDEAHTIDLLVEFDGEIEAWETETLEGGNSATLERDWDADREGFRVTARLNEGDPIDITPSGWNESDCLSIFVRITDDERMTYSSNTSPGHCDDGRDPDDADEE
ncbi:hypothetical protein [Natronolimnohabitans innermongolicus]|uniref:Uncharacterized protein n=1 Tax=Natronolimnohabitans innermongolicus JCM 12255 TaxID=1227499 RepID=L9X3G0_9EURY|nr:hypothetical protein [Natronolimnohabitans innermongolicus]ELY55113.1 hypothetical protein C493_11542 [Natronolimnohabitans innermongolicus JCM 12255]